MERINYNSLKFIEFFDKINPQNSGIIFSISLHLLILLFAVGLPNFFGLILSIALMATAATLISNWIKRYKWIAWIGLLAILIVAIELIYTDLKLFI